MNIKSKSHEYICVESGIAGGIYHEYTAENSYHRVRGPSAIDVTYDRYWDCKPLTRTAIVFKRTGPGYTSLNGRSGCYLIEGKLSSEEEYEDHIKNQKL